MSFFTPQRRPRMGRGSMNQGMRMDSPHYISPAPAFQNQMMFHHRQFSPQNRPFSPQNRPFSPQNRQFSPRNQGMNTSQSPRRMHHRGGFQQSNSGNFEFEGSYPSQRKYQARDRQPFFHQSMLENPWGDLENDFEEVQAELMDAASDLIETIPMTMCNWMRTPKTEELPKRDQSDTSIAKLANTVSHFESQLQAEATAKDESKAEKNCTFLVPADFDFISSTSDDQIEQTSSLDSSLSSISDQPASPLLPSSFRTLASDTSVQSPPFIKSNPATPDNLVKPRALHSTACTETENSV